MLQCGAVCCSVLQCVAALLYQAFAAFSLACAGDDARWKLHCVAVCCSVLQCVAMCCSALQCVANTAHGEADKVCCSVLQCVAVC